MSLHFFSVRIYVFKKRGIFLKTGIKIGEKYYSFPAFAAFSLLTFIIISYISHALRLLTFPFPFEYGEGVAANYIIRVLDGQNIYPEFPSDDFIFLHNPYGPVFFYVSAIFAKLFSNAFFAGRLVSLLSYLSLIIIFYLLYGRRSFSALVLSFSFFAASPLVWRYSVMCRVDFLALAFTAYSFYFLHLYYEKKEWEPFLWHQLFLIFLSGVFSALAFLVKPLYFISLLSCGFALINLSFRRFAIFASGVISVFAVFFSCILVSGLFMPLLMNWGRFNFIGISFFQFSRLFLSFLHNHPFCFLFFIFFLYKLRKSREPLWYFLLFSGFLAIFALKNGAMDNYFLPVLLFSSIAFANFASDFEGGFYDYFFYTCLAVQLGLFLPVSPKPVFSSVYGFEIPPAASVLSPGSDDLALGKALLEEIKSSDGLVLGDEPGYLLLAGKQIIVQPYQYGMLVKRNIISANILKEKIEKGYFSLFVIRSEKAGLSDSYFPDEITRLIRENYSLKTKIGDYEIYE